MTVKECMNRKIPESFGGSGFFTYLCRVNSMMNKIRMALLLCVLAVASAATVWADTQRDDTLRAGTQNCAMVHIVPERLPDLNIPRTGHSTFYVNGELTVTGGHTTNFVPTQTAEYFADGEWHQLPMAYCHDNGFAVVMGEEKEVIIGGGHSEPLGIGQTFMLERYTPATHSFEGFGCLDRRRVLANGILLDDGRVIITGNHYTNDDIACYDGRSQVQQVKGVAQGRSNPYILKTAKDNAIIIRSHNIYQALLDTIWADQVSGDAFRVPFLEQWPLLYFDQPFSSDDCSIGEYSYLLTATDRNGQLVIVQATFNNKQETIDYKRESFSLLPTVCPIPMQTTLGPVFYKGPIIIDKKHQRGYVIGVDSLHTRQYVLAVDYAQEPAGLTLYYTDTLEYATITIPIVTPEGDLILAGGIHKDNYKPVSNVWLYHFATEVQAQTSGNVTSKIPNIPSAAWLWALVAVVVAIAIAVLVYIYKVRRMERSCQQVPDEELMMRILQVIEQDNRYLKSLRLSDIASELGVSVATISDCLSSCRGCTLAQLLAEYRVRHAQKLITDNPDLKLAVIIAKSGFTSESTFFRTFKAVTGKSPKEWLSQCASN